ncbi:MAG: acyl-CoA dehydrogenase [Pseudomonadota bacterium]|nr:acyl-CoA dehydrogenase [Pseudomonadota bacterium]
MATPPTLIALGTLLFLGLLVSLLAPLRRTVITGPLFRLYQRMLPAMSATEQDALEAGTVWFEGELFRGRPDWQRFRNIPSPRLSGEEQAFLDHDTCELCALVDDWQITRHDFDMPAEVWRFIKERGFLGMIIPREYGGKGFSAFAHSEVIARLSTRASSSAVTVMVPNSLGPAELLLHYGTEAQKQHYLPRLACGDEIPCFALTSPWAGSDAAAIPDAGVVCRGQWQGQEVLGMRVSWDKRYITLAPVATVLGLAFRLFDPERLLGGAEDIGITCALIPRDHPGVEIGRRHLPLDAMFMNGPTRGHEVFMPLEFIIGGPAMAGQGWRMLMECLAAGRAISLPSSNAGMAQVTTRAVGAYARIRSQFALAIGRFEGVEEALARMGGLTYQAEAMRVMTAGAVDLGEKPSVVSAIAKYHCTENARRVVNDGMDVIGGKGICLGPSNFLGRAYQQIPIGITVEGANILTRSLILFGQGAIRCHPHVLEEMHAAHDPDPARGLARFDRALGAHLRYTLRNGLRALLHGLTGARLAAAPAQCAPGLAVHFRQISRLSAALAVVADVSMLSMGGDLKRREKISARLGDVLACLYIASAALKRFETQQCPVEDRPLLDWAVADALWRAQEAFAGVLANYPSRPLAWLLRVLVFPLGWRLARPSDALGHQVASLLIAPTAARERLTRSVFLPADPAEQVAALEAGLQATLDAEPVEARVRAAHKQGAFGADAAANVRDMAAVAYRHGVISAAEHALLQRRNVLRDQVIRVDDFPLDLAAEAPAALRGGAPGGDLRGAAA